MATAQKKIIAYFPAEQARRLEEIAKTEQRPIAGILRLAVDAWLAARDKAAA